MCSFKVYTDGIFGGPPFSSNTQGLNAHDYTTRQIGFGRKYPDVDGNYATYRIDDLIIWNGFLLSDAEILQLYYSY